jgi:hypothetical protein
MKHYWNTTIARVEEGAPDGKWRNSAPARPRLTSQPRCQVARHFRGRSRPRFHEQALKLRDREVAREWPIWSQGPTLA